MKQPINILIVEDEVFIAMHLRMELRKSGYEVSGPVVTGEEAITRAAEEQPDIVLMDIRLAGKIDGIEAAREIRAHDDIPIIFMTGYENNEVRERAQQLNPLAYFIKPVSINDLKTAIDSACKNHEGETS